MTKRRGRPVGRQQDMFPRMDRAQVPDDVKHMGHCLTCGGRIEARTSKEWHKKVRQPCPHCGARRW